MAKVVLSAGYGAGFCNTNEQVYNWLKEHGGENLITVYESSSWGVMYHFARESLRYNDLVIQCIEELGVQKTGYEIEEYDETKYDAEINEYDGLESLDLIPLLDVELMTTMTAVELAAYLDDLGVKHNYGR